MSMKITLSHLHAYLLYNFSTITPSQWPTCISPSSDLRGTTYITSPNWCARRCPLSNLLWSQTRMLRLTSGGTPNTTCLLSHLSTGGSLIPLLALSGVFEFVSVCQCEFLCTCAFMWDVKHSRVYLMSLCDVLQTKGGVHAAPACAAAGL